MNYDPSLPPLYISFISLIASSKRTNTKLINFISETFVNATSQRKVGISPDIVCRLTTIKV